MLLLSIFTTTLYTSKIFFKVFFGESTLPKEEQNDNPKNENDRQMLLPLFILTAPSVFLGLFIYDPLMIGILFQNSLAANELMMSFYNGYVINSFKFFLHSFTTINFLILLIGLIFSYLYYYKKAFSINVPHFIRSALTKEYGFESLSSYFIPKVQNIFTKYLWRKIDISTIDNGLINNTSSFFSNLSSKVKKLQTGFIYHYSLIIISALIFLLILMRITY